MPVVFNPFTGNFDITIGPAGSDTQVQFNDGGVFGGDTGLVYNKTTDVLTVGGLFTTGKVKIDSDTNGVLLGDSQTAEFRGAASSAGVDNLALITTKNAVSLILSSALTQMRFVADSIGGDSYFQSGVVGGSNAGNLTFGGFSGAVASNIRFFSTRVHVDSSLSGFGLATATAVVHIKAGTATANTAPLKLDSGPLLTTAEAGALERNVDDLYFTIATGAARKGFVLDDGAKLIAARVPFATATNRLTSNANLTFVTDTLTVTNLVVSTGNLGIGTSSFGASMTKGVSMQAGVAPTGNVSDAFQFYAADQAAGNAVPHFRTENGNVVKLFKTGTYTPTNVTADRAFDANATSVDELADVVGTLIADMQLLGVVG